MMCKLGGDQLKWGRVSNGGGNIAREFKYLFPLFSYRVALCSTFSSFFSLASVFKNKQY